MNRIASLAAVIVVGGSQAFASGYTAPVIEPIPYVAPAPVANWTGAYGGLSFSRHGSGEMNFVNPANGPFSFIEGSGIGAFGGYTRQYGGWVVGGELAYYNIEQQVVGFVCCHIRNVLDVSARAGHAWGNFQIYGLLGFSTGVYDEGVGNWNLSGHHLGLGAEYMVNRRFAVGLQYVTRRISGDNPNGLGQTVNIDHDTLSLRGMFRF